MQHNTVQHRVQTHCSNHLLSKTVTFQTTWVQYVFNPIMDMKFHIICLVICEPRDIFVTYFLLIH